MSRVVDAAAEAHYLVCGRWRTIGAVWVYPILYGLFGALCFAACRSAGVDPPQESDLTAARERLLAELRGEGIHDARVLDALRRVPREEFVRPQERAYAYANQALPIGGGQTISQPYVVAIMTQLLELRGDERVLEIGTGSGYQAAILAALAAHVFSIEIDPQLASAAGQRLKTLGFDNVEVRAGDGSYGWEEAAPFDAIIVTAVAPRIPERLLAQLRTGGRLVMPLGDEDEQYLIRARKREGGLDVEQFAQVLFVPMMGAVRTPTP